MKQEVSVLSPREYRLTVSLFLSNALSVALYLLRIIGSGTNRYSFMLWNLFLAVLPLIFSTWLSFRLRSTAWSNWRNVLLTILWFGFLPNSFYMITDLVHLQTTGEINIMFDTVLMVSFIFNGLFFGYVSLYQIHRQLAKRLSPRRVQLTVAAIISAVSFAIYLGRSLRWNSWDIILNPAGILFDVSDRLIHPISYPEAILTTITFSLLLGVIYLVIWQFIGFLRQPSSSRPK